MRWNPLRQLRLVRRSVRYRREHAAWLSRALASPRRYPRIPTRAVHRGGFRDLMARPEGRLLAEYWWLCAFDEVEGIDRFGR